MKRLISILLLLFVVTIIPASALDPIISYNKMTSDVAGGGSVIVNATSTYSATYRAWKAFDGINIADNCWVSITGGSLTQSIWQYNQTGTIVTAYGIIPELTGSGSPSNYTILGSDDNVTWTTLETKTGQGGWVAGVEQNWTISNTNKYKYYNLSITGINSGTIYFIREVKYYGVMDLPDTTPPDSITALTNTTADCDNITWTWTNPGGSLNADYSHLYTLKNDVYIGNYSNSTSAATWTTLSELTAYTFSSKTVDLMGNTNGTWVNRTTTTSSCKPVASFSINTTGGMEPLDVGTVDTSTNTPTSWAWGAKNLTPGNDTWFSIGTGSTNAVVLGAGNWSMNLTATNAAGSNISTQDSWVNVTPYILPPQIVADFTATPLNPAVFASVSFTDTSTGGPPTKWLWDFGDGTTSSVQNPTYAYATAGLKTVTLTASLLANVTNNATVIKTNYINVTASPPPAPVANFNGTPTTQTVGAPVQFVDMSANTPTGWSWDFGDSTGSSLQNPAHVYSAIGNYTVALTATNPQGSDTMTKINYTTIVALAPPVASFTTNTSSGQSPLVIQFNDTSTNNPTSWVWTFYDDMSTQVIQNPVHTFIPLGTYNVSLKAVNAAGNSTVNNSVTVTNPSGFNRVDLTMPPQYTFVLNIVDASGNPIPGATVLDSNGYSVTTPTGVFTYQYPYSVVIFYVSATGYTSAAASYIIDSSQTQTITLSKTVAQSSTTWYVPKTIEFRVVNYANNQMSGATLSAKFNTSSTLIGGAEDLKTWYGMNPTAANEAVNGTLIMSGITDTQGVVVLTMLSTLSYDVYVTSGGTTNYFNVHPQNSPYLLRFVAITGADTSLTHCVYDNGNTHTGLAAPDPYNMTMMWSYQDTCGLTTALDYIVKDVNNGSFVIYNYHLTPVTSGIYINNLTVSNTRGANYIWYENATRSV
jgi:PKD repeat protein